MLAPSMATVTSSSFKADHAALATPGQAPHQRAKSTFVAGPYALR